MARYTFTREKNIITFTDSETNRSYEFDINRGVMSNPKTGRVLNSCPVGFGAYLDDYYGGDCVVSLMGKMRNDARTYGIDTNYGYTLRNISKMADAVEFLIIADKIQSLGATIGDRWYGFNPVTLREVNENFKAFAKYCRTTEKPTVTDFIANGGQVCFVQRYNLDKYHLSDAEIKVLYDHRNSIPAKDIPYFAYYFTRGVYEFYEENAYNTIRSIRALLKWCDALDIEPPKGDYFRNFINIRREYAMRKKEIDARLLIRRYDAQRDALSFEFGDFEVVIPSSSDDFKKEADAQRNCVYSSYLQMVLDGDTHVVFVRRKNALDKSLVTCEVRRGHIQQFLLRYNHRVTESDIGLLDFKDAYQRHLNEHWHR